MAGTDEDDATVETTRLLEDIAQLRVLINAELDAGGGNRALMLACAQLIREKTDRLQELGWME
jgi:hypothetical protein